MVVITASLGKSFVPNSDGFASAISGVQEQWGCGDDWYGTSFITTFPISFSSEVYQVQATDTIVADGESPNISVCIVQSKISTTKFNIAPYSNSLGVYFWIAIGK